VARDSVQRIQNYLCVRVQEELEQWAWRTDSHITSLRRVASHSVVGSTL
jgi:hypothetical protein